MVKSMFYYLNLFLVYSLLGYGLETIFSYINQLSFDSGIFYGTWTPIYGIGVIVITLLYHFLFDKNKRSKWMNTLLLFISTAVVLSTMEILGGILIEKFFHTIFWDYSNHHFPITKYASIEMGFVWGGLSIVYIYLIMPWMDKLVKKIPYFLTCFIFIAMVIDVILSFIFKVK